jgi:hypothetical protein
LGYFSEIVGCDAIAAAGAALQNASLSHSTLFGICGDVRPESLRRSLSAEGPERRAGIVYGLDGAPRRRGLREQPAPGVSPRFR